jgi:cyclic beta-1,2-glucan synthetase
MYCHGVQWLIRAARLLAEQFAAVGDDETAKHYRDTTIRLWRKISPIAHMAPDEIEVYGGQPNKQSADMLTTFDQGRMIWNGYTGAAGWMLRQACEGVIGATLVDNRVVLPVDLEKLRGDLQVRSLERDLKQSPLKS